MPNALKMLHSDHEEVNKHFEKAISADSAKSKGKHFNSIASDLEIHASLEEEIFYPQVQAAIGRDALMRDALEDHHEVKRLISQLHLLEPSEPEFDRLLLILRDKVKSHVAEEERDMFPAAETALGKKLDDIGSALMRRKTELKLAPPISKQVDINLPAHTVYEQWTHFEDFPKFMEGVEEVRRSDGNRIHWRAKVGGKVEEWDAQIDDEEMDSLIAWHSISGTPQSGRVAFRQLAPNKTRVSVEMVYKPKGVAEHLGAALGVLSKRVEGDLHRFKQVAESRYHV